MNYYADIETQEVYDSCELIIRRKRAFIKKKLDAIKKTMKLLSPKKEGTGHARGLLRIEINRLERIIRKLDEIEKNINMEK